jgi:hypothetical protein
MGIGMTIVVAEKDAAANRSEDERKHHRWNRRRDGRRATGALTAEIVSDAHLDLLFEFLRFSERIN